jgi:sialic acid synthase SpsE
LDTYFIAEVGVNHEGDLGKAKKMINQVASSGAQAVKFQTYKADKLAAKNSPGYWDFKSEPTRTQHELFSKFDGFNKKDYIDLADHCKKNGVDFLSTPFDLDCLDWLIPLMPIVKIASADLNNYLLLEAICSFGKPIILSVGASSDVEILNTVKFIRKRTKRKITLLHCMLFYPTPKQHAFLGRINDLKHLMIGVDNIDFGYSDHISPDLATNDQLIASVCLGARVIEKHFTYDRSITGNDHYHALDIELLNDVISRIKDIELMLLTTKDKILVELQKTARKNARRSLYYKNPLPKGHVLVKSDIVAKRPGIGLTPDQYLNVLGKKLNKNVEDDDMLTLEDFR